MKFQHIVAAVTAALIALIIGAAAQGAAITVTSMSSNTADSMANALVASMPGVTVVPGSATYTGASIASGTFTSTPGTLAFNSGILLTTGSVNNVPGPNNTTAATYSNNTSGDASLNTLVGGSTNDAAVLSFDFVSSTSNSFTLQYIFGSEEYPEYVGTAFNDALGFFLNGINIAVVPGSSTPISINSINASTNSAYFSATAANGPVQYDGLAGNNAGFALIATGNVTPGAVNHLKLAIADRWDTYFDSGVFIRADCLGGETNPQNPVSVPLQASAYAGLVLCGMLALSRKHRRAV
jgi:hypothetical protein